MINTLIKEEFAVYFVIEPGDGTRYSAFYVPEPDNDPDNVYIAIGPGSHIIGGYFMRRSSLKQLALRIYDMAKNKERSFSSALMVDYYIGYLASHLKVSGRNVNPDWDVIAAALFGIALTLSPTTEDTETALKFIGDVYRNRHVEIIATLVEWGITPPKENEEYDSYYMRVGQ